MITSLIHFFSWSHIFFPTLNRFNYTWITGKRHLFGSGVLIIYIKIIMFINPHGGLVNKPAWMGHEYILICSQNLKCRKKTTIQNWDNCKIMISFLRQQDLNEYIVNTIALLLCNRVQTFYENKLLQEKINWIINEASKNWSSTAGNRIQVSCPEYFVLPTIWLIHLIIRL